MTWLALRSYALGEVGLLPEAFYDMTWEEWDLHEKGFRIRQYRDWERARLVGLEIYNAHYEKRQTPQEYLSLPTDPEVINKASDKPKETTEEFLERMKKNNFYRPVKPDLSDK